MGGGEGDGERKRGGEIEVSEIEVSEIKSNFDLSQQYILARYLLFDQARLPRIRRWRVSATSGRSTSRGSASVRRRVATFLMNQTWRG